MKIRELGVVAVILSGFSLGFRTADEPVSEFIGLSETGLDLAFCAEWDPEFSFRGHVCCGKVPRKHRRRGIRCNPARSKRSFCDEMTQEQREYAAGVERGEIDVGLVHRERAAHDPAHIECVVE